MIEWFNGVNFNRFFFHHSGNRLLAENPLWGLMGWTGLKVGNLTRPLLLSNEWPIEKWRVVGVFFLSFFLSLSLNSPYVFHVELSVRINLPTLRQKQIAHALTLLPPPLNPYFLCSICSFYSNWFKLARVSHFDSSFLVLFGMTGFVEWFWKLAFDWLLNDVKVSRVWRPYNFDRHFQRHFQNRKWFLDLLETRFWIFCTSIIANRWSFLE